MLEADNLECARGGKTLFRALSFAVKEGESLRIAGANGRGKTSLLKILCGLLPPAEGRVSWRGEDIRSLREEYSRELVFLGHAPAVKDDLTAEENLELACRIAGRAPSPSQVREALERLGVPQGVFLKKLSQGQRKRAALARLVLSQSVALWLLDEPFSALDADAARLVEGVVSEHVAEGGAAVFTTHQESRLQGRVLSLDA